MDDKAIYDFYVGTRAGAAMAVAVRTGLIDWLAQGEQTAGDIGARFSWAPRPTDSLLTALTAMGILSRTAHPDPEIFFNAGDRYALTPEADAFLVRGRPEDLGGLVDMEFDSFMTPAGLLEAMKRDAPQVYGGGDPWEVHGEDAEKTRNFARAMHSISIRPARAMAALPLLEGRRHLLDVGGGSGVFLIECLRKHAELRATLVEIPAVIPLANELAKESGVADRMEAVAKNMFEEEWPDHADTILLSQILHDWPPEKDRDLLKRAFRALPSGGMILVHEKLLDSGRREPLANALVSLDMLFWTEGQQLSEPQIASLLGDAGFGEIEAHPTTGYWTVTAARKP